jgi:hypothetical protein
VLGLAEVIGPVTNVAFSLVNPKANIIQPVSLTTGHPEASANELTGAITIPKKPFRLMMTGKDPSGRPVQRVFPTLYGPH